MGASIDSLGEEPPKKKHILKRFYGYDRNLTETQKVSQLIREITTVYQNIGIATVHPENIRLKLKTLIKAAKLIISTRKLSTNTQKQRESEFLHELDSIFAVATIVPDPQEVDQYQSSSSLNQHETRSQDCYDENNMIVEEYEDTGDDGYDDEEFELPPPQKKQKISLELLKKINSECSQNASYRVMSTFIGIGIEIAGGNPKAYCISKSQLQSQLTKIRSIAKSDKIDELLSSNSPLLLQFDTKSCHKLNKRHLGMNSRFAIILRSEKDVLTLGPYILPDHGAETCSRKIIDVIEEHNLHDRIVGIVCDTENTNTGQLSGICFRIEDYLERDLLYFMCRHHIYDLNLKHVSEFLFGRSTAPTFDFGCCSDLKREWENLQLERFAPFEINDDDEETDDENDDDHIRHITTAFRANAIRCLKMQAEKKQTRDDYAELTDLALKCLGSSDIKTKRFMVPGSVNNARWMGRGIYALKCFLFRHQIDFDHHVLDQLSRFSLFISTVYVKYWNWCPNVFNAPINDLKFLKELEYYRVIDDELATVAINAFSRHLTYISDEMVVLSLFSKLLDNEEKEAIRSKLVQEVGPRTAHSVKRIHENNFSQLELHDFVSDRSMFLFSTLNIDSSFIQYNTSEWENLETYHIARQKLKNLLVVVNDSAERALGQISNMINHQKARTEENLQNMLTCKLNS